MTGFLSAPPQLLYHTPNHIKATECRTPPENARLYIGANRYRIITTRVPHSWEIRPRGKGRHGLFKPSSATALSPRWLLMANGIKLMRSHDNAARVLRIDFGVSLMVWGGDKVPGTCGSYFDTAQAFVIPKMVLGATIVLKSLKTNSQKVYEWYHSDFNALWIIERHRLMTGEYGWSNRG